MRLIRIVAAFSVLAAVLVADAAAFNVRPNQTPPSGLVGQPYAGYQVDVSGGTKANHQHSIGSGSLPPGLSISTSGYISGTPTQAGSWGFWVKVFDPGETRGGTVCGCTQGSMSIEIGEKLTATSTPLPFGTVGVGYSRKLTATGPGPYSWSVASGTLPPGVTLAADGTLAGIPTTAGTFNFVPKVTNGSQTDTLSSGLSVEIVQPLKLTSAVPPNAGVVGAPYSEQLTASGGKPQYTFSVSGGTLPPGLVLNASTGVLAGTPTTAGTYPVTLSVSDTIGNSTPVQTNVTIIRTLEAVTKRLPPAKLNVPYRGTLISLGGLKPTRWELVEGFLPRGIKLAPKNGRLVGKPRVAGTFELTFQVSDKIGGSSVQDLTLTVRAPKLLVVRKALPVGKVGKAYRGRIWAKGGAPPRVFAVVRGALPRGIRLDRRTGKLSGVARSPGLARFVVRVTDSVGTTAARLFVLKVNKGK
jgi:hypothetical protein